MYTDSRLLPVYVTQQYIAVDGTKYPWDYPKNEIPGLHLVTETEQPNDPDLKVTGFTIDENYTQIWTTEPKL